MIVVLIEMQILYILNAVLCVILKTVLSIAEHSMPILVLVLVVDDRLVDKICVDIREW
jgi:hypothetical protein